MLSVFLIIAIFPTVIISYCIGFIKGYEEADQFKQTDECDTPIYNQMALEHPETFMFMKAKQL
jgi:hypothetical protein